MYKYTQSVLLLISMGLIAGSLHAGMKSELISWLKLFSLTSYLLFFSVGLHFNFKILKQTRLQIFEMALWTTFLPAIFIWITAWLMNFSVQTSFVIVAILLCSGTGVVARAISLQYKNWHEHPQLNQLVALSIMDDIPALVLLWMYIPSFQGDPSGVVGLMVSTFLGLFVAIFIPKHIHKARSFLNLILSVLLPIYFFWIGLRMSIHAFFEQKLLLLIIIFSSVAIMGKVIAVHAYHWLHPQNSFSEPKLFIWGLIPRGVPGLAMASLAYQEGVLTAEIYSILVAIVTLTTVLGLWGLKPILARLAQVRF